MFVLKQYQKNSIAVLKNYLSKARFINVKNAYEEIQKVRFESNNFKKYNSLDGLENVPYICLRLPTGGGKTLLSAYTIELADKYYIDRDYPLALWLVPTDKIKQQTLETLKNTSHPNHSVLNDAFNGNFRVFDIADFRNIRKQDIDNGACVIVSTFASLRVDKTEGRKVYAHDENFEPHFSKIKTLSSMEKDDDTGDVKYSFANLLHWHRPLVIIDEAHNAKSDLSIELLRRINAACVVEYTATPAKNSNVIHSVTAAELKAEEMIKLPMMVTPHQTWEQSVTASIQTRQKLEELANKDSQGYIRPIVLFQAENKGQDVTVEVLRKYLVEYEKISLEEIAVATGTQKELDDIDLFNQDCPIRYVITVQALKEGWDCSFAYVLCSVANTKSSTAIEQLLGRVLRMPYAQKRSEDKLNNAYVHISSKGWLEATNKIKDCLINMGFEAQEAEEVIYATEPLNGLELPKDETFNFTLTSDVDLSNLDMIEQTCISTTKTDDGKTQVQYKGVLGKDTLNKIVDAIKDPLDKKEVEFKGDLQIKRQPQNLSPSQKGEVFNIPQLCLNFGDDETELAESQSCLPDGWSILDYFEPLTKEDFTLNDSTRTYLIDLAGKKVEVSLVGYCEQLSLNGISTNITEKDLCSWLDHRLHARDINQSQLVEYLRQVIYALLQRIDLDIAALIRGKFILTEVIKDKINQARIKAQKQGFQQCLFGDEPIMRVDIAKHYFTFKEDYPVNAFYIGSYKFKKHYYPLIGAMNNEEVECAKVIDMNPLIKYWVRNLERNPTHAFWLPTSTDKFYPDFVAKLYDDRIFVVEYKGQHLITNEDSKEKDQLGEYWAKASGNLFLMASKKDDNGRGVFDQIDGLLKGL